MGGVSAPECVHGAVGRQTVPRGFRPSHGDGCQYILGWAIRAAAPVLRTQSALANSRDVGCIVRRCDIDASNTLRRLMCLNLVPAIYTCVLDG